MVMEWEDGKRAIFVDVSGQRSDKKKWMHYFDSIDLVSRFLSFLTNSRHCNLLCCFSFRVR